MRKVFTAIFLAAIILISGNANAQDVYVGTSDATGRDCYVMTETIYWANPYDCEATLKMVRPSDGNVQRLHYHFEMMHHWTNFTNSQGFSGRVSEEYPIEWNMWHYIMNYSNDHKIRYK